MNNIIIIAPKCKISNRSSVRLPFGSCVARRNNSRMSILMWMDRTPQPETQENCLKVTHEPRTSSHQHIEPPINTKSSVGSHPDLILLRFFGSRQISFYNAQILSIDHTSVGIAEGIFASLRTNRLIVSRRRTKSFAERKCPPPQIF
jgi:hypothetical protein